ncbi:uncharacterized protein [Lepeophtheirus salmonis]|nr:uncharacterized protein LOC121114584 [Lepeophtheirus salmonis]
MCDESKTMNSPRSPTLTAGPSSLCLLCSSSSTPCSCSSSPSTKQKDYKTPRRAIPRLPSLATLQGRRVAKKYRKYARNMEYRRLRSIVPAVAHKRGVSKGEILEEAIKYIDSLHEQLISTIRTSPDCENVDGNKVIETVQSNLRPQLERRVSARRRLDALAVRNLISTSSSVKVLSPKDFKKKK